MFIQIYIPEMLNRIILFCFILFIFSCKQEVNKSIAVERLGFPDAYLLQVNLIQSFDSSALSAFIINEKIAVKYGESIRDFYARRNYTYAWFNGDTLSSSVYTFYNLLHWFWDTGKDSLAYNPELDSLINNTGNAPGSFPGTEDKLRTEFLLTTQFFEYASYQYEGRVRKDLRSLDWFIPRGKKNYRMLLDSLVADVPDLAAVEPVNRQYQLLKTALLFYYDLQLKDTLVFPADRWTYRIGDSSDALHILRLKLAMRGDVSVKDTNGYCYDQKLFEGIKWFQQRNGMEVNGRVSPALIHEIAKPLSTQIRTLLLNMERSRWVPDDLQGDYILVNIPEYRLHVNRDTNLLFSMNVVVGKEGTETVIFNGVLSTIVFCPYWNVPQSIILKEMLPILKRNPNYLLAKDMEVLKNGKVVHPASINWSSFNTSVPVQIRQRPGPKNSLGHIKFLFPNQYSIYLHDTPSRYLFNNTGRTYSHGCIRIADPVKLATFLLRDQPEWTPEKIENAMYAGKEHFVKLTLKVPVFVSYFTAWVDRSGKVNFRKDIYGHDKKLASELFAD